MAIDPRISLGVQQLQLNDPLAQYGQVQNILASQAQQRAAGTQQQAAQLNLAQLQRSAQYANEMQKAIADNGGPLDINQAAKMMATHPDFNIAMHGIELMKALQDKKTFEDYIKGQSPNALTTPAAAPTAAESIAPVDAAAPAAPVAAAPAAPQYVERPAFNAASHEAPAEFGPAVSIPVIRGMPTNLNETLPQTNALASPAAAPANNLTAAVAPAPTPGAAQIAKLKQDIANLSLMADPRAAKMLAAKEAELKTLLTPHVVGPSGVLTGASGEVLYQAPPAPSGLSKLQEELNKMKPDDPRRSIWMSMIKKESEVAPSDLSKKIAELAAMKSDDPNRAILMRAIQKESEVAPSDLSKKIAELAAMKPGDPNRDILMRAIQKESQNAPSEEQKLIELRNSLPKGSPDYNAVNAKVNQAAEQAKNAIAHLAIATRRLNEEMVTNKVTPATVDMFANLILDGKPLPNLGMGKQAMDIKQRIYNRATELSANAGATPADTAKNIVEATQNVAGQAATVKDFASGEASRKVRSNNTALNHLETMDKLAGDLANNDIRIVNAASNAFAKATGSSPPANFDAAKQIVANEVMKAVVANGGTGTEREEAGNNIKSSNGPKQLREVLNTYRDLLGGQLSSLQLQYETGSGRKDFESKLTPAARDVVKKANPAAAPANKTKSGATVSNW